MKPREVSKRGKGGRGEEGKDGGGEKQEKGKAEKKVVGQQKKTGGKTIQLIRKEQIQKKEIGNDIKRSGRR